jgi:hypothetical protein
MEESFNTTIPFTAFQEGDAPSAKDEWARRKLAHHTHKFDQFGAELRDIKAVISDLLEEKGIDSWKRQFTSQSILVFRPIEIPLNIRTTFGKLEEDFSDFSNRIVWCNELKNYLSKFEEELEEYEAKYLSWFVSTLKDVFSYNYAETITKAQLELLRNGIKIIYEKQENCDKGSFAEFHLQLVESGLSLLPNTKKAIDEFGE